LSFKKLEDKLNNIVKAFEDPKTIKSLGASTAKRIVARSRKGLVVDNTIGTERKNDPLRPITKERRRRLKSKGQLDSRTSPNKSNLTATGKMLNDVQVTRVGKRSSTIGFKKKKERVKAKHVQDAGREFFNLSNKDVDALVEKVVARINKAIKE